MQFASLVITAISCATWTTLVTVFSKFMLIFVISMIEIGFIPILRQFYGIPIFGQLFHFSCCLDHFGDSIFRNHVHIHNQHA